MFEMQSSCADDLEFFPLPAHQFHLLSVAYSILQDASKRSFLAARLESDRAARARREGMESRRRGMVEALLEREKAAKRQKEMEKEEAGREAEEEAIKLAGRKMREQAAAAAAAQHQQDTAQAKNSQGSVGSFQHTENRAPGGTAAEPPNSAPAQTDSDPMPSASASDLTLTLQFPSIPDPSLLPSFLASTTALEDKLRTLYGPTSFVVVMTPSNEANGAAAGKKAGPSSKRKGPRAVVEFASSNWSGCWACWKDHARKIDEGGRPLLPGTKIKWAGATTTGSAQPAWMSWAERQQTQPRSQSVPTTSATAESAASTFPKPQNGTGTPSSSASSFPSSFPVASSRIGSQSATLDQSSSDYEAQTMFRMRQMERRRLEEEIRRREAEEE